MLRPRLIVSLLIKNGGLVKSENFKNYKYVGDPLNAVKIFSEKNVDELMIVDIDASVNKNEPDMNMIRAIAERSRMPITYGGGVKSLSHIEKIINLGVEKVSVSSALFSDPKFIETASSNFGKQSIVGVIDVKRHGFLNKSFQIFTHNGKKKINGSILENILKVQKLGIGELVINSIDHDGLMIGYDRQLIREIKEHVKVPLTCLGGAKSLEDCYKLINEFGYIGAASGSMFVFNGKYKAVLIQYPGEFEKKLMLDHLKL